MKLHLCNWWSFTSKISDFTADKLPFLVHIYLHYQTSTLEAFSVQNTWHSGHFLKNSLPHALNNCLCIQEDYGMETGIGWNAWSEGKIKIPDSLIHKTSNHEIFCQPWFGVGVGIPGVSCWETMEKVPLEEGSKSGWGDQNWASASSSPCKSL